MVVDALVVIHLKKDEAASSNCIIYFFNHFRWNLAFIFIISLSLYIFNCFGDINNYYLYVVFVSVASLRVNRQLSGFCRLRETSIIPSNFLLSSHSPRRRTISHILSSTISNSDDFASKPGKSRIIINTIEL